MNPHVIELLAAYHDGELTSNRQQEVEKHLRDCPTCRAELEALEALSSYLKADSVPTSTSPERFAAQVQLRLPRSSMDYTRQKGEQPPRWVLGVPVVLIITWAFLQAALWVTAMILTAGPVSGLHIELFPGWITAEGLFEAAVNLLLFNFILIIGTTILWSAWMALWLAWKKSQNFEPSSSRL
jgi:anti-sigma factor RsiW